MCLKLRPGVLRRPYSDGVVVYVAETCEIHILPPDFEELLKAPYRALIVEEAGLLHTTDGGLDLEPAVRISSAFVKELLQLKILERAN